MFGMNSYSYTFDHTAETFLTNLAGRGYREFELMVYPGHMWPKAMTAADRQAAPPRRIARRPHRHPQHAQHRRQIAAASDDMRALCLDHLERIIGLAGDLGAAGVVSVRARPTRFYPCRAIS